MPRVQAQTKGPNSQQQNKQAQKIWVSWEILRSWLADWTHLSHGFDFEYFLGGLLEDKLHMQHHSQEILRE